MRANPLLDSSDLKQRPERGSANGAVVGLVAQRICTRIAQTEMAAGQNQCIPGLTHAYDALAAMIVDLLVQGRLIHRLVLDAVDLLQQVNKFKTGGLVITAVQQPANMPGGGSSRRMRNAAGLQAKSSIGALGSSSGQMQYQRSNGNVQANKTSTGISLDTVNLVRKVKTKLKKRKSRTLSNGAPK